LVKQKYGVGIIGCGLIGLKRANSINDKSEIRFFCDIEIKKAKSYANKFKCSFTSNWKELIDSINVDIVIISTTHNLLAEMAEYSIDRSKPTFIEKPGAFESKEFDILIEKSKKHNIPVHVGYNHRFHPSFIKAKDFIKNKKIGDLYFIRAHYGHGGRIGYDSEWRSNKNISGGGELIDQGTHLIDLSMWLFEEDFLNISGNLKTYFWDMDVEDNVFMILETKTKKIANLHASWTEWKNQFHFEIVGETGKILIEGLGGSYGKEKLTFYKMKPEMGVPEIKEWSWEENDSSWVSQWSSFINDVVKNQINCEPGLESSKKILKIVDNLYGR